MINPRTIAKEVAYADIATQASQVQKQQADVDAENAGLDTLSTSINDFETAVDGLNSAENGVVVNTATASDESVTTSANSEAQPGTYSFYVTQLAQTQQDSFAMADDTIPAQGTVTLTMGDSAMDIDLASADSDGDGYLDGNELVDAINDSDENPGVTATLMKTDDGNTIMLSSDQSGAASAFTVSVSGNNDLQSAVDTTGQTLSSAQDAVLHLGTADGPQISSSTNTFDDVIPGVSMTFSEVTTDEPVTITVAQDTSASQAQVQVFVDAYNTLADTIDDLTDVGSGGSAGGVFAGDAGLKSLSSQMNQIVHADYNGYSIIDYGITLDSNGHLTIDSSTFDEAMKENPEGLTDIFVGDDGMIAQFDDLMDTYTNSSDGIITTRQQSLDDKQDKIDTQTDKLQETYEQDYERYLSEYTNTMIEVYSMKMSMAAFG
ncbi:flagellar filament capping protein FliD [Scandinavium sp. TWS1a]|uniref:flagellar filament capping protein FliD n=1 Tax=Scandinavium tedordense TaxID=2926521 RepID=UPI0021664459|nr:flagellar filament capping protein FliD [Scandinavium tedordense]MCS2171898.1 flagellar filament capping protein FliD [Scandinavium tedordense]